MLTDLAGKRVLTFNSVVRVNQIEVTRERVEGKDEAEIHTPEAVRALRDAFRAGWPGATMTWALSWRALHDERPQYRAIRDLLRTYHEQEGDDVTFIPGGYFAPMYNERDQINRDLHEGLARVQEIVGGGYRPTSVVAGFLPADCLAYLADVEDVHVCQGSVWSQYAIDNGDGDGSISYPYYPSREHFCKAAQSSHDFIDCVNLDGWTVDFVAARYAGATRTYTSRMGVGPIETIGRYGPEVGVRQMLDTTAVHFGDGLTRNGFGWVTNCWEISLVDGVGHLEALTAWLKGIRQRWPDAVCCNLGEFGEAWRREHQNNDGLNYAFYQRGTGLGGSEAHLEVRWYMNQHFRLALIRDWQADGEWQVLDLTRYTLPASEPQGMGRNWSLMGDINQKGTRPQDRPRPFGELGQELQRTVLTTYPDLEV
jgi:hypothetical protein